MTRFAILPAVVVVKYPVLFLLGLASISTAVYLVMPKYEWIGPPVSRKEEIWRLNKVTGQIVICGVFSEGPSNTVSDMKFWDAPEVIQSGENEEVYHLSVRCEGDKL